MIRKSKKAIFIAINMLLIAFIFNACTDENNDYFAELEAESSGNAPIACFQYESEIPDTIRTDQAIQFNNCSSNGQTYFWDFNDGTTSNEINPSHHFTTKGAYTVTLKVINSFGIDSSSVNIKVNHLYDNYILHNDSINKLEKINVLSARYRSKERFCIQLSGNNAEFGFDTITGNGIAVQLVCNGDLRTNSFEAISGSKFISHIGNSKTTDLSNSIIDIRETNGFIEVFLKTEELELYYKGLYTTSHYYNYPTIKEIERSVKSSQDPRATHTFEQYEELLSELTKDKYRPMTIWEMFNTYDSEKVIVGLRHDVDCHPFKAVQMAKMEHAHGINASYYILATSNYYGQFYPDSVRRNRALDKLYLQLHNMGSEIGIHNDLLAVMISKKLDPFEFNQNELAYYKSLGIPIYGNVGHGSSIASQTVHNSQMFSDYAQSSTITYNGETYPIGSYSMYEYGFLYEANFFPFNQYYSESGGRWSIEGGFYEVLNRIKNSKPGDRIQILTHPVWWGK